MNITRLISFRSYALGHCARKCAERAARWQWLGWSGGMAAGAFVAALLVGQLAHQFPLYGTETDFVLHYEPEVKRCMAGELPLDDYRGPVFPAVVAAIASLFSLSPFAAAKALAAASAGVSMFASATLFERMVAPKTAKLAALCLLASLAFFQNAFLATTDVFFLAQCLTVVVLMLHARGRWTVLAAAGLLSGVAIITRYNGVFLPVGAALAIVLSARKVGCVGVVMRQFAAYAAGLSIPVVAWGIVTLVVQGEPFRNENHRNIAYALYGADNWEVFFAGLEQGGVGAEQFSSLREVLAHDPPRALASFARNVLTHPLRDLLRAQGPHLAVWLLMSPGAVGALRQMRSGHPSLRVLSSFVGAFYVVMGASFYSPRLFLFPLPLWSLLSALGMSRAAELLSARTSVRAGRNAAITCGVLGAGVALVANLRALRNTSEPEHALAEALQQTHAATWSAVAIAARKPHLPYYLGARWTALPATDDPIALHQSLCADAVDYLYAGKLEIQTRPVVKRLLEIETAAQLVRAGTDVGAGDLYRLVCRQISNPLSTRAQWGRSDGEIIGM